MAPSTSRSRHGSGGTGEAPGTPRGGGTGEAGPPSPKKAPEASRSGKAKPGQPGDSLALKCATGLLRLLGQELKQARHEQALIEARCRRLSANAASTAEEYSGEIQALEQEVAKLRIKEGSGANTIKRLGQEVARLEEQLTAKEEALQAARSRRGRRDSPDGSGGRDRSGSPGADTKAATLAAAQRQVTTLNERLDSLTRALEDALVSKHEVEELEHSERAQIKQLTSEIEHERAVRENLEEQLKILKERPDDVENKEFAGGFESGVDMNLALVTTANERAEEAEAELSEALQAKEGLEEQVRSLTKEHEAFVSTANRTKRGLEEQVVSLTKERDEALSSARRAKRGLEKKEDEIVSLTLERDAASATADHAKQGKEDQASALIKERDAATRHAKSLEDEIAALTKERDAAVSSASSTQRSLEDEIAALTKERDAAASTANRTKKGKDDQVASLIQERDAATRHAKSLEDEIAALTKERDAAASTANRTKKGKDDQVASLIQERDAATRQAKSLEDKIAALTRERDAAVSSANSAKTGTNGQVKSLTKERDAALSQVRDLEEELATLHQAMNRMAELEAEIEAHNTELESAVHTKKPRDASKSKKEQAKSAHDLIAELTQERDEAESQATRTEKRRQEEVAALTKQCDAAKEKLRAAEKRAAALNYEAVEAADSAEHVQALKKEAGELQRRLAEAGDDQETLNQRLQQKDRQVKELQDEMRTLKVAPGRQVEELRSQVDKLKQGLKAQEEESAALSARVAEAESQREQAEDEREVLRSRLQRFDRLQSRRSSEASVSGDDTSTQASTPRRLPEAIKPSVNEKELQGQVTQLQVKVRKAEESRDKAVHERADLSARLATADGQRQQAVQELDRQRSETEVLRQRLKRMSVEQKPKQLGRAIGTQTQAKDLQQQVPVPTRPVDKPDVVPWWEPQPIERSAPSRTTVTTAQQHREQDKPAAPASEKAQPRRNASRAQSIGAGKFSGPFQTQATMRQSPSTPSFSSRGHRQNRDASTPPASKPFAKLTLTAPSSPDAAAPSSSRTAFLPCRFCRKEMDSNEHMLLRCELHVESRARLAEACDTLVDGSWSRAAGDKDRFNLLWRDPRVQLPLHAFFKQASRERDTAALDGDATLRESSGTTPTDTPRGTPRGNR